LLSKYSLGQYFPGAILGLNLSAFIIFILWFLFGHRPKPKENHPNFFGVGLVSGLTTVFIGATFPLIAPFFLKDELLAKKQLLPIKQSVRQSAMPGKFPSLFSFSSLIIMPKWKF